MGINRYTKPIEYSLQNTQVLPRTEILAASLEKRQQKYDTQAAILQEAHGTVSNYKVVGDAAKQDLKAIEDMLSEGSTNLLKKDLADPSVQGEVNKLVGTIANNEKLKTHLAARESYVKFMDQYQDLAKRGKLHESNVYFQNLAWQKYKSTGDFSDSLADPIIPESVDVISERKKLVDMIKANGSEAIGYLGDTAYKTGHKGVDGKRLLNAVDSQLNSYAMSAAGQQEQRDYLMKVHQGAIDPKKQSFGQYLRQEVWSTAQNFAYSESTTNIDSAINSRATAKREKEESIFPMATGTFKSMKYDQDLEFNEKGEIKGSGRGFMERYDKEGGLLSAIKGAFTDERLSDMEKFKHASLLAGAKANGVSAKEYYEATNKDGSVEYNMFTKSSDTDNWSKIMLDGGAGNLINLQAVGQDGIKGSGKSVVAKALGLDEGASSKEVSAYISENKDKLKVLGFAKPNEHTAYGMVMSINGQNAIIDLSHMLNTDAIKPEKKYEIIKQHAFATANSGLPTPTKLFDDYGKLRDVVLYKNIHTNKIEVVTEEEFTNKVK